MKNHESRFRKRLMQQMHQEDDMPVTLDDRDQSALNKFETAVDELMAILTEENAALEAGEVDKVEPLFTRKSEVFSRLEIHEPVVEPILEKHIDEFPQMREKLRELDGLVNANGVLIERITTATSAVAREVKRIQKRHSLDGLYEKTGRKLGDPTIGRRRFDEKL